MQTDIMHWENAEVAKDPPGCVHVISSWKILNWLIQ